MFVRRSSRGNQVENVTARVGRAAGWLLQVEFLSLQLEGGPFNTRRSAIRYGHESDERLAAMKNLRRQNPKPRGLPLGLFL
jgi:hypothetical protein